MKKEYVVSKSELPLSSSLKISASTFDYIDSFKTDIPNCSKFSATEIATLFIKSTKKNPKWITYLMFIRNFLVELLGLKKTTSSQVEKPFSEIKIGEKLGIFELYSKSENEIILGKNDRHLNFRLSILSDEQTEKVNTINISTLVKFNNSFGKFYFAFIKPFHRLIAKAMLLKMRQEI